MKKKKRHSREYMVLFFKNTLAYLDGKNYDYLYENITHDKNIINDVIADTSRERLVDLMYEVTKFCRNDEELNELVRKLALLGREMNG